jgi:hypothetical protein
MIAPLSIIGPPRMSIGRRAVVVPWQTALPPRRRPNSAPLLRCASLGRLLAALDLALDRLPQQVRPLLAFVENCVDARKSPCWEARWHLLFVYSSASHA